MHILLTGGTGQAGTEILGLSWPDGVQVHAPPRAELDLRDPASIGRAFAARRYGAVISAGAYTAVDRAETEVAECWQANAVGPAALAAGAARAGIPIVHLSTDYVFDGLKGGPYLEDDPIGPLNVYGASKAGGEAAVRTANPRHAILRTAWVMSPHGHNFVRTMLRLAGERDEIAVVADQRGSPTFAADLAEAVRTIVLALAGSPAAPSGTFHLTNAGEASWSELAAAIFTASARRGGPAARIRQIPASAYPTAAARPAHSRLVTGKVARAFGIAPRAWQDALDDTLDRLIGPVRPDPAAT